MSKTKFIENKDQIVLGKPSRMSGFYDIEVMRGSIVVRTIRTKNLITNQGLDFFGGAGPAKLTHCHLGVSEIEPQVTDVQLGQFICVSNPKEGTPVKAVYRPLGEVDHLYGVYTSYSYVFPQGVATGSFNEIGIGSSSASSLFSHAKIIDNSTGEPATITVLEQESLRVTYFLIQYPPLTDGQFEIDLGASQHVCMLRAANCDGITDWAPGNVLAGPYNSGGITAYSGDMGLITGGPTGSASESDTASITGTYHSGDYTRECFGLFRTTQGNFTGGIKSIFVHSRNGGFSVGGAYQVSFDPPIMKNNLSELRIHWNVYWNQAPIVY